MSRERNRVCPVEIARSLDSRIRRWVQDPRKVLAPFVKEGMTVLDVGCGPGFFSMEMADLVGPRGKVIAADLQEGMLQKLRAKITGTPWEERMKLVHCGKNTLNVTDQVDFILAFYMVHEVPDKERFFKELKCILRGEGQFLLIEPKLFHVSAEEFGKTTGLAEKAGFTTQQGPRMPFSWSAMLRVSAGA